MEHILLPIDENESISKIVRDMYRLINCLDEMKRIKNDKHVSNSEFLKLYMLIFSNQSSNMYLPLIIKQEFGRNYETVKLKTELVAKKICESAACEENSLSKYYKLDCYFYVRKGLNLNTNKEYSYQELKRLIDAKKMIQCSAPQYVREISLDKYNKGVKNEGKTKLLSDTLELSDFTSLNSSYIASLRRSLTDDRLDTLIIEIRTSIIEALKKIRQKLVEKLTKSGKTINENEDLSLVNSLISKINI